MALQREPRRRSARRVLALASGLVAASAWFGAVGFLGFPERLAPRLPFGSTVAAWRDEHRIRLPSVACGRAG
jgi:hypothetical protein